MQNGVTPLSAAIDKGQPEAVDTLLKYGADPNLTPTVPMHSTEHRVELILCSIYVLFMHNYVCVLCQLPMLLP